MKIFDVDINRGLRAKMEVPHGVSPHIGAVISLYAIDGRRMNMYAKIIRVVAGRVVARLITGDQPEAGNFTAVVQTPQAQ